jgi:aryl-alcohol dehydrogenase-like predicted oxidoreductase
MTANTSRPASTAENFYRNLELAKIVQQMAQEKGCTAAQLALAWVLAQGRDIVPIPGTKHLQYLRENLGALKVCLAQEDLRRLEETFPIGAAAGERYHPQGMKTINR